MEDTIVQHIIPVLYHSTRGGSRSMNYADRKGRKERKYVNINGYRICDTKDNLEKDRNQINRFCAAVYRKMSVKKRNTPGKDKVLEDVRKGRSIKEMAAEFDVTENTVRRWFRKYEIPYQRSKFPGKEVLQEDLESMPKSRIAAKYGVCVSSIPYWIEKYDVRYTPNPEVLRKNPGKEKLEEYMQEESVEEIAGRFHVRPETVRDWIRQDGIHPYNEVRCRYPGDEVFREECSRLTETQIADREHVSRKTVFRWMKDHDMQCCRKAGRYPGDEVFREACQEETENQLAETFGVKRITIEKWMKKNGIHCQYFQGAYPGDRKFLEDMRTMRMKDIAVKYDRSLDCVKKWRWRLRDDLKRYGITIDQAVNGEIDPEKLNHVLDEIAKERFETQHAHQSHVKRRGKKSKEQVSSEEKMTPSAET